MVTPTMRIDEKLLAWKVPPGWRALSSAAVGGGLVEPRWVLNLDVGGEFVRTDLEVCVAEAAARSGLDAELPGCGLLTAADVTQVQVSEDGGVRAWATVGVTKPTWPVPPVQVARGSGPGTINIVVTVPVPLTTSALVQAVGTITEAKAQVLVQAGVPGTGTASDALVVLCPAEGPMEPFAGVRSTWGQRIAGAVHGAVAAGLAAHPWPADDVDPGVTW